jgi:predicted small integral membrane protein
MITRLAKTLLLAGVALFYTLVVFNNLTDFNSNYQFVRHVLSMDTTFPGNQRPLARAASPAWHSAFYIGIIAWEIATTILLWWGVAKLLRTVRSGCRGVQHGEASAGDGAHAVALDVAGCISGRGRRMVLDVAVARMEWAGSGLQKLRLWWGLCC